MEWVQALTVIASLTAVIGIVANLLNKRIDDLRQDMDRRFSEMDKRLDRIEQDIREIRQLLYKIFELPQKGEK
ncbi:hypothetical protein Hydth_1646 [Hydrogenobacter thermophilus TK-6]|uniref:Uncharacterized protein n=1 Tax=Hydrogenobacter thermophilus (strain DSM 6534 / IAM 12695 / TK-6) TaxID=608538 RepID=D3DJV5_HYDTT|nr:hypothetical protein [Hydrogenobacter thermophilus]ADO46029.1 hypothetical protein Hydth_1646 [Hydrogenobacter thermophilus TK-6]BAI70107.1 hypothetical protein HTH_1660 [Hydrogenobacter thermophilus TK-6]